MTWRLTLIGFATAFAIAGCGGGDPVEPPRQVYVAGDSLNDVGVFGVRFTVQSANAGSPYTVWTEQVAQAAGVASLCAAYKGNESFAPVANCTGHAVGGAQINPVSLQRTSNLVSGATIGSDATPMSIVQQIKNMAHGRTFGSKDLILVDGGGNDANALASSLLEGLNPANPFRAQAIGAYATILKDLLDDATVDAAVTLALGGNPTALIQLGGAYMQAAATMLSSTIKSELLAKGAQRVVLLNLPDLSKTPALNAQPDQGKDIVRAWSQAMNAQLQTDLASESRVLVVDFYATINGWVSNPASGSIGLASLSNVTTRACGNVTITNCTDSGLDSSGPGDWRTHLFADNLHSTPFGNQLLANVVQARIASKGWN
jgi:outer membrane lipase/esterase